jgi:hypothetical protein
MAHVHARHAGTEVRYVASNMRFSSPQAAPATP